MVDCGMFWRESEFSPRPYEDEVHVDLDWHLPRGKLALGHEMLRQHCDGDLKGLVETVCVAKLEYTLRVDD
jgi:hypothetical protein